MAYLPDQYGNRQPVTNVFQNIFPKPATRTAKGIVQKAQFDSMELAVDERLTEQAIEAVAHLDNIRLLKARSHEANTLMFELESAFASRSARKIANRNSPLAGL
ncbi:MAG: hypothetical protein ABIR46_03085 [Candidatus Saccharimonadales bacterium]